MRIVAFDASTEACAVALFDGARWLDRSEHAGASHSQRLLPIVRELLAESGIALRALDGIAFGAGPGSFTGLRIACGVAQGLALGTGLPLLGVGSLEAIAETAHASHGWTRVACALDARMREVYFAAYEREEGSWRARVEPCVLPPAEAPRLQGRWFGAGNGFAAYGALGERLAGALAGHDGCTLPTAVAIGTLALPRFAAGEGVAARDAAPLYVRHRVALTAAERDAGQKL
ncbi:MAG TPA: tRNA (adenosine(37)-N6)-threonylcarbamoyltransferase complex dimerization subunit type 1 TsaB [Casimicrobiaceae bacterium]|jgi:tRNA threonylcarbamoyladenosine biosynthesis protein TsaB|nr:tRNA (adenosine(37)-N6)-threonylcarbamoyltransferase complex dimerization subunit type 1 TsaB [Casimicrobiaceae bacterium]